MNKDTLLFGVSRQGGFAIALWYLRWDMRGIGYRRDMMLDSAIGIIRRDRQGAIRSSYVAEIQNTMNTGTQLDYI